MDMLFKDYADGNIVSAGFYFVSGEYEKCVSGNHGEHDTCHTYHEYSKVILKCTMRGSLEEGFAGTVEDTGLVNRVTDNEAHGFAISPRREEVLARAIKAFNEDEVANYNKQGKAYTSLKEQLGIVSAAIEACKKFEDVCTVRLATTA